MSVLKLIVGLGNPGSRYAETKHNVGFMVLNSMTKKLNLPADRPWKKSHLTEGTFSGQKLVLAKPQTFMNLSGQAVVELLNWYKLDPSVDLLVVYDDLDLPLGKLRLRPQGRSGGHKGIESIIALLGTTWFPRLKVGIGRPPAGWETPDYVLSRFTNEERPHLEESIARAVEVALYWSAEGINAAMNKYN